MTGERDALPGVVVLAASGGAVGPVAHPPGVQVLDVGAPAHLQMLRVVHGDVHTEVPTGGGAVLVVRGRVGLAAAGWTAVEHGTSELVGVVTVDGERRRGFGALAVTAAAAAAARAGADLVWLRTHDAGAQRLYRALGFEPAEAAAWP